MAQSGQQALKAIRLRMPELLDDLGSTESALIEKYLVPLLSSKTTRYFRRVGRVGQKREVADNNARLKALDMALWLRGAYAPTDLKLAEPTGVKVILMDTSRPGGG